MKKPLPPDDNRIEIILADDTPETQQTAIETARILSAGKLIPEIRKQIEESRFRLEAVVNAISMCEIFVSVGKKIKGEDYFHPYSLYESSMSRQFINGLVSPTEMPSFLPIINQVEIHNKEMLISKSDESLRILIICHEEIKQLLTPYITICQEELAKHEERLETLMRLVTQK